MQERHRGLDGLRGVAIVLVFLEHSIRLPGGWVGVELFFVLSGFLITTILRHDRDEPHFWTIYLARRASRILPPYFFLLLASAATFPLAWKTLWPYYVFFGQNIALYRFDMSVGPLAVLWSLAIEEQFYFVWPFAVRRCSDKSLLRIAGVVIVAEPLIRGLAWIAGVRSWTAFYVLTPFRLDGLALGAMLSVALSMPGMKVWLMRWTGRLFVLLLILSLICFGWLRMNRADNLFFFAVAGYTIVALVSSAFLSILVLKPEGWLARAMAREPLVFLGKISYGFYLYHWLLILVVPQWLLHWHIYHLRILIVFPLCVLMSILSFRYIEMPITSRSKGLVRERKRDIHSINDLLPAMSRD